MAARPLANPVTYGTVIGSEAMSALDTSFGAVFTSGFNDSALGWVNYATDIGALNVLSATLTQAPSTYAAGLTVAIKVANTNTGTATLNLNALGAQPIVTRANTALQGGEMPANTIVPLVYDGTSFRIAGPCPLSVVLGSQTGNINIECAGYTSINVSSQWSSGVNPNVALAHLAQGVPVIIVLQNTIGSSQGFSLSATSPAGTAFTQISGFLSGGVSGNPLVNILAGSGFFTIANGNSVVLTGGAVAPLIALFSK